MKTNKQQTEFKRKCPECVKDLYYINKQYLNRAVLNNSLCNSCANKKRIVSEETKRKIGIKNKGKIQSEETKQKISNSEKGKKISIETRLKISKSNKGHIVSKETRKKLSLSLIGNTHTLGHKLTQEHKTKIGKAGKGRIVSNETRRKIGKAHKGKKLSQEQIELLRKINTGKIRSEEVRRKNSEGHKGNKHWLYNKHHSEKTKLKIRIANLGKKYNEETKLKHRLHYIKRIENSKKEGIQLFPFFNKKACEIIDLYGKENEYNFQHAMNGGEYFIEHLGYWVDGYDKEKNVVIEIDENHHFNIDGTLKEKDIIRQKQIENALSCKFIRIKYDRYKECAVWVK